MDVNAGLYLNLIRGGAARLASQRQTINDLNVFPIPDGDTGDNMYMTIEAGANASGESLSEISQAVSRGMLMGARGNSGVILSRIFAGMAKGFEGLRSAGLTEFSAAMDKGVEEAYHAVSQPVEGTILTVLREGVAAAREASSVEEYFDLMTAGMEVSLEHTPDLLDVLKKAGVVDSGGAGLLCIAEGMRDALHGDVAAWTGVSAPEGTPSPAKVDFSAFTEDSELEFGYCTEFLLRLQRSKVDLDSFDESVISEWLASVGDSLVFFRDGSIIKVHVHTKDPGAVLSRCRQWGEFLTVKVENMTLQHHENHMDERFRKAGKALGVVTVAAGEGLRNTFLEMGADEVIEGGQTMNPPVERFIEAFDRVGADTVLVFPNNGNILLTARQAAALYDKSRIEVVPTRSLGEGYYALANLDPSAPADEIVPALEAVLSDTVTGQVSRAIRDSAAGNKGDWLGMSSKDILCGSPDRTEALLQLATKLDAPSRDVAVLFSGADVPEDEAAAALQALSGICPHTETIHIEGGQPVYDYILLLC